LACLSSEAFAALPAASDNPLALSAFFSANYFPPR
jgi:hypothetical protein